MIHISNPIVPYRSCTCLINRAWLNTTRGRDKGTKARAIVLSLLMLGTIYPVVAVNAAQAQTLSTPTQTLIASLREGVKVALSITGQPSSYYSTLHAANGHLVLAQKYYDAGNISGAGVEIQLAMQLTEIITQQNRTTIVESDATEATIISNYSIRLSQIISHINDVSIRTTADARMSAILTNVTGLGAEANNTLAYSEAYGQLDHLNAYIVQNYALPQFSNEFRANYSRHYQNIINSGIDDARSHGNLSLLSTLLALNSTANSINNIGENESVNGYISNYNLYYNQIGRLSDFAQIMRGNIASGGGNGILFSDATIIS